MAIVRLEAIVLRTYPLRDTSRIVVLYTRERGLVRAVAKGARQPKSRFAGALEPLGRVEVVLYVKEERDLELLSSAELLEATASLEAGLERITHAQAAAEFVDRLVWGEEAHAALYDLLLATLRRLALVADDALSAVTLAFQLQAASLLGYRPVLDRCVGCGREEKAWQFFAPGRGGVLCGRCAGEEVASIRLSRDAVRDLSRLAVTDLANTDPGPNARAGELLKILEVYLQNHFQRFSGLRSLELLRELDTPTRGNPS
jgi:DNA repair protein RecO (recombination protein O)